MNSSCGTCPGVEVHRLAHLPPPLIRLVQVDLVRPWPGGGDGHRHRDGLEGAAARSGVGGVGVEAGLAGALVVLDGPGVSGMAATGGCAGRGALHDATRRRTLARAPLATPTTTATGRTMYCGHDVPAMMARKTMRTAISVQPNRGAVRYRSVRFTASPSRGRGGRRCR